MQLFSRTPTLTALLDGHAHVLRTQLDGVYDGGVDPIHDARVATRRIRELLALVPRVPGRDDEDTVARGYRKIGRALGKVRDIDVQIALLRNLEDHTPQTGASMVLIRKYHEDDRLEKTRALIKTLERIDVATLIGAVTDVRPASLRRRLTNTGWREQLRHLLQARAHNALEAIVHATGIYFPRRAHGARIAIKQLRYAVEIAQATGHSELQQPGKTLRKGQEILGDLHDRQELSDTLAGYRKEEGVDPEHVQLAQQVMEREVTQLHAEYLSRRSALRDACEEVDRAASSDRRHGQAAAVGAALAVTGILYKRQMLATKVAPESSVAKS